MITLKNISHSYETGVELLKDVSLAMRRGESFVIVGPSGLGKSTLLKIISGLIPPQEGQVLISDRDLYSVSHEEKVHMMNSIGMLFQKNALFDSLTVGENLAFPLREASGLAESEIFAKVRDSLEVVGLGGTEKLYPEEISGGMQKRVGIARALILKPEIILYDDPTAGLDPITSRMIVELIKKLNKELGATTISITNDMNRAYQLADRMGVLMEHGFIALGTSEEIQKSKDPRVYKFIRGEFDGS